MTRPRFLLIPFALFVILSACHGGSPTEPKFPEATLTGNVTYLENGAPAGGAHVTVSMSGDTKAEAIADAQGRYSLHTIGGSYVVSVFAPGSTHPAFIRLLDLGPTTTMQDFQISSNGCAIMAGRVLDGGTRAPIAGASIAFFGLATVSGSDGSYSLNLGCPPQPAHVSETIVVDHPGYQHREFLISVPTYSTTADIYLQPR
jgi:hypothetical protein